jgi:hypothetical protein
MSNQIIAYCGINCSECPALIATREADIDKLRTLALEWYNEENDTTSCLCDGCNVPGRKNKHCVECGVYLCASQRGEINCAYCDDYGCETLTKLFDMIPIAKENLERIRASL